MDYSGTEADEATRGITPRDCGYALRERMAFRRDDELQELRHAVEEIKRCG